MSSIRRNRCGHDSGDADRPADDHGWAGGGRSGAGCLGCIRDAPRREREGLRARAHTGHTGRNANSARCIDRTRFLRHGSSLGARLLPQALHRTVRAAEQLLRSHPRGLELLDLPRGREPTSRRRRRWVCPGARRRQGQVLHEQSTTTSRRLGRKGSCAKARQIVAAYLHGGVGTGNFERVKGYPAWTCSTGDGSGGCSKGQIGSGGPEIQFYYLEAPR